ncbi:hypothetical protein GDO78_018243 [Eleutherodactylus coqui]|uniref:IRG-type G domain-containing protein n=1 Tax=Eleutherodactylus coqui TaxID=57060 RepID=A0A8J6EJK7_ELECQ|nr:hypothetical protein GDO78_018243 [Eleutherodactylus coqui]
MYTDEVFSALCEDEVEDIIRALYESTLCDTVGRNSDREHVLQESTACDSKGRDFMNPVKNIAIMGQSGSGKSTLVNAIRGLHNDEEENAAKTGVVETTMEPTAYPHPTLRNLIFWDFPGTGTPNCITQSINYHQYDLFIIIASERVRHSDMELAKNIWSMKKKLYFVRNKIDTDLRASKVRRWKTYDEQRILHEIQDNCIRGLSDCGIDEPRVFLLSCLELDKYDFHLLMMTLEKEQY